MKDETLSSIGERVAESMGTGPDTERLEAQKKAVQALTRRKPRWGVWAGAAAAAVILVLSVALLRSERPMEFWVGAGLEKGAAGQWVEGEATVRFGDGSVVEVGGESLARVVEASGQSVRLVLDHGRMELVVVDGGKATWSVVAGRYVVTVTGTEFSVSWDGESLEVEVGRGEVLVQGPEGKGTTVRAGDVLRLGRRPEPQPVVEEEIEEEAVEEVVRVRKVAPKPVAPYMPRWKQLAGDGEFAQAVQAAEDEGFEKLLANLGPSDLWELASAARYARQGEKALMAYEAYRKRFPSTKRAATATFLLGRVEMEIMSRPGKAAGWFSAYLDENPGGPLEEEALGRLINAHKKAGNAAAAHKASQSYLSKYPEGIFRDLAGAVLAK